MKKPIYFSLLILCLGLVINTSAQDLTNKTPSESMNVAPRRLQAGMTTNLGFNVIKMGDNKFNRQGFCRDLTIGMIFHTSFKNSPNLGIATGLEFDFSKFGYAANDSMFYRYEDNEILKQKQGIALGTEYRLTDRSFENVYVSIPLMMLFRTEETGDWRFFGKFGLRNSFLVSQKINDEGFDVVNGIATAKQNLNMKSFGESFFYRGSIGFSAGAEWNFAGTTCLVPEFGFFYGLTPMHFRASEGNQTLYNSDNSYFFTQARQNQLILKVSILF